MNAFQKQLIINMKTKSIWDDKTIMVVRIREAEIDQEVNFSDISRIWAKVVFRFHENDGYIWVAQTKDSVRNLFPMRTSNLVKHYKTLDNAKKSFLKRLEK